MDKKIREIDSQLRLLPYYDAFDTTLQWYQERELCMQMDNKDHVYSLEELREMYEFLNANGYCYYMEYKGQLAGDITLRFNGEICIAVSREYQNLHIGRRSVAEMLKLAKELGYTEVKADIYPFNTQSRRMFRACGFAEAGGEWFVKEI